MSKMTVPQLVALVQKGGDGAKLATAEFERRERESSAGIQPVNFEWTGIYNGSPMGRLSGPFRPEQMGAKKIRAIIDAADRIRAVLDKQPSDEELAQLELANQAARAAKGSRKKGAAS